MDISVSFPGGMKVDAAFDDGTVARTDQKEKYGGEGSAPEPYQLFLASLATCTGIYALRFCQLRGIPTDGLRLVQKHTAGEGGKGIKAIDIEIEVPASFPDKYREALARAAGNCPVKRTILAPPAISVRTV